jgi:hypothetical protein
MPLYQLPNGGSGGGGSSREGDSIVTAGPFTDTSWYAIDDGSDMPPGEYELIIRGAAPSDVYELTWESSISASEQSALGASVLGRAVWVNSPIAITVTAKYPRLAVRALSTPSGTGWSAVLSPIV